MHLQYLNLGSRLHIIAICVAVAVIGVIMRIFGPSASSLLHDVTIQTSTTMPPGTHAGKECPYYMVFMYTVVPPLADTPRSGHTP